MLYLVQVVLSGVAEIPRVFLDGAKAESAFVECVKTYWAQSYAAYCERHGVDSDCFSSAQGFIAALDLADRSRVHYWSVTPEDAAAGGLTQLFARAESLRERQEHIRRLAGEVEQASCAVKEGLTELLGAIADLAGEVPDMEARPAEKQSAGIPEKDVGLPSSPPPRETPAKSADTYNTREWKAYVESIKGMCGGNRAEFHLFTRADWRQAVYSNATSFEYWEWVAARIDDCIEAAQNAGYSVIDDPEHPGHYRFKTPDGVVSEISCSAEGDAWCRAGLHAEGTVSGRQ
jgi:hypothetical protein